MISNDSIQKTDDPKDDSSRSLHDLDELIALSRRRLARLEVERSRELSRGIRRLLEPACQTVDPVGDRLFDRLDELARVAERRLAQLEAERAEVVLTRIDQLFQEGGGQ